MDNPTSETLIENISTSWREIYKMEKLISQHKKVSENEKVLLKLAIMNGNMIQLVAHMKE